MAAHSEKRDSWPYAIASIAALGLFLHQPAGAVEFPESCEFTAAPRPILMAMAAASNVQREPVTPQATRDPPRERPPTAPELLRPPQEQELKQLGGVIKALATPEKSASTLVALGEGRPFTLDRYLVLLGDVRSILIYIQAGELRGRLDKNDSIKGDTRAWIEPGLQIMETCAPARFVNRGGNESFQRLVEVMRKWRTELQPLVFQVSATPTLVSPPGAGATLQATGARK
jgi:hypothetical protein